MTRIVTDSTSDIPSDIAADLGIVVVPAMVMFGREALKDGIDISRDEFYARLARDRAHPTTAAPGAGAFAEAYRALAVEDREIVSIHVAGTLSGLLNSAHLGSELVADADVVIVDSGQASMGTGLQAIEAAKAARDGGSQSEILDLLSCLRPRTFLYAAIDTMEYLRRGGRVRGLQAAIGNLLHIKPILSLREGQLTVADKVVTMRAASALLLSRLAGLGPVHHVCVLHSSAPERAREFARRVAGVLRGETPMVVQAGSTVGAHTGPGCIGLAAITSG